MRLRIAFLALVLAACRPAADPTSEPTTSRVSPTATLVDLTHTFDATTLYWPTEPTGFRLERIHHGPTEAGFFYAANRIAAPEHGGTHLDAPLHFAKGRASTDAIPLAKLIGPAVVVDMSAAAERDADALLDVATIESFEREHGRIAASTIVLVRSGWSERWPDRMRYLGDDTPGDASKLHFPGVSEAAAAALVERRIAAVGIDTASIDHGPSKDFPAHRVLAAADVPIFENVAALERLPATGATVIALPMKIGGGSGGPLRIVALLP